MTVFLTKYFSIRVPMALERTSAGMSPGLSLPSREWISTPSQVSTATLARYSWERCIGLRVWNAATVDQPFFLNISRVWAGVRNSSPYFSGKPPCERTFTGPARLTSPCSITILTPGCSKSVVLYTIMHSCALSMVYFSVTFIVAMISPDSLSTSATSEPVLMPSAVALSAERVIGIGQNRPLAIFIPSQTPCQSALVIKPSRGVKPPMPSMMRSPVSREAIRTLGSDCARCFSSVSAAPCSRRVFSSPPPCGLTSLDIEFSLCANDCLIVISHKTEPRNCIASTALKLIRKTSAAHKFHLFAEAESIPGNGVGSQQGGMPVRQPHCKSSVGRLFYRSWFCRPPYESQ